MKAMTWRYRCARCGCHLDSAEGTNYPGYGRICEDCIRELEAPRRRSRPAGRKSGETVLMGKAV